MVVVGMWYGGGVSGEMLYGGSDSILCSGSGVVGEILLVVVVAVGYCWW